MNEYFVIEISDGEDAVKGKAVYGYDTETEAVATFHQKLATAMKSGMFTSELVMVINSFGSVIKRERFGIPVEDREIVD